MTIIKHTKQEPVKGYKGQPMTIGGLLKTHKKIKIQEQTEREFKNVLASFNMGVRSEEQRHSRKLKRRKQNIFEGDPPL